MRAKRVLLTGGAGFIGSNLARRLVNEKFDVTVVDDMSAGRREFLPGVKRFLEDDFSSPTVLEAIRNGTFDFVMHLAAKPRVSYSMEFPLETHEANINKTVQLLDACRLGKVKRFVNTSSSSVYGGAKQLPTPELTPHDPKSPYALQKSVTEQYCRLYSHAYGMDTVSVRPFNVFGPNALGDNPYATAVSSWLYAIKHDKPLRSDGDGTQTRDITYVTNVVDVFYHCLTAPETFMGDAFNGGTDFSVSNNEVLDWFKKHYPNCEVVNAPPRPGDVKHTRADMDKVYRTFSYRPKVDFWKGLELTHAWAMNSPLF